MSDEPKTPSKDEPNEEDPRLQQAVGLVRQLSNPHLKEQCLRTEWAAMDTDLERDLLVDVVADETFWDDVKDMTMADVEAMPEEKDDVDSDARLLQMFKCFDKDNSGTIDANELHQMFLYMGISTTDTEVREMIAQVDKNGDGDIDEEEFLTVMKSAQSGGGIAAASPNTQKNRATVASANAANNESAQADVRATAAA
jgi:Ca2+-binding EF-hand superfamily protein